MSTRITSVHSYLHAWLDVTASCYNTFNSYHSTYCICLDVPHLTEILFRILSRCDLYMVASFKLCWNALVALVSYVVTCLNISLRYHLSVRLSIVLPSLLHEYIKCGMIIWTELTTWLRHVCICYLSEETQVPCSISFDSVQESLVSCCFKMLFQISELNIKVLSLFVGNFL